MISRRIVDYAVKNNAGTIQMEDLKGIDPVKNQFAFRNWSYYELQLMVEQKAIKEGIKVTYTKVPNATVICSLCGEEGEVIEKTSNEGETIKLFKCDNPDCSCHDINKSKKRKEAYEHSFFADFNAARNIAMAEISSLNSVADEPEEEEQPVTAEDIPVFSEVNGKDTVRNMTRTDEETGKTAFQPTVEEAIALANNPVAFGIPMSASAGR